MTKRLAPVPLFALILVSLTSGCRYGQSVENFPPAHQPEGARVIVAAVTGNLEGELIEVHDSGLIILADGQLQALPYASFRSILIEAKGQTVDTGAGPLEPPRREEVRLLSRYPQGLPPELLERLLAAYGQTELVSETQ